MARDLDPVVSTPSICAAHLRRQQDDSLSLLAGMQAEREERFALAPLPAVSADALLADIAACINEVA